MTEGKGNPLCVIIQSPNKRGDFKHNGRGLRWGGRELHTEQRPDFSRSLGLLEQRRQHPGITESERCLVPEAGPVVVQCEPGL